MRNAWHGLAVTCLFFLVAAILTLPKFPYPGDNFVPRNESIQLAKRGQLGIPYAMRELISGFDQPRGQYFYSNDKKERFYSKYGIAYTVAYLPPVWAELASNPAFDVNRQAQTFFFKLGIYQVLLGLLVVYYLFRLAWLFGKSQWICCAFTLATVYSTFLWHYLRAPALEIYQLLAFTGACAHALLFLRRRQAGDGSTGCWMHLLAVTLWSGALVLMKSTFVIFGLALSVFPFFVGTEAKTVWLRPFVSLKNHWKSYAWTLAVPWVIIFAILLAFNAIKFSSPFDSGYMQWLQADGKPVTQFGWAFVRGNMSLFLVSLRNDFNLFHAYPYALAGVLCFIPFARRWRVDALLMLAVVLPGIGFLLFYNAAHGQWCYGPRYFIFYVMLLAFPFLWWLDRLFTRLPKLLKPFVALSCLAPVLYMAGLQFMINGLQYFVSYQLGGLLSSTKHPAVIAYCNRSRVQFCRDVFCYGQGWSSYYPLDVIRPLVPPERRAEWLQFKATVDYFAQPNFYFFPGEKAKDR
ncbi:MAG: hypothetical protein PHV28_01235 [Kiritimatiellae bacterium]|nr:hypothetical protein [Kiritimatiellia bacterium]